MIRPVKPCDAEEITSIYNYYVAHTIVTFEETPIAVSEMLNRIEEADSLKLPFIVAVDNNAIIGYAFASKWKGRCAYKYSVEITVYLAPDKGSNGWGTKLYTSLFAALKSQNFHVVLGGISLPNEGSIALHEKFGMTKVGHLKEVGFKFNQWVDVGYWQGVL